jgi:Transposase, Mutator family.
MKDQADSLNELCFELYAKGLTTRDIESITETIYGQHLSKAKYPASLRAYQKPCKRLESVH